MTGLCPVDAYGPLYSFPEYRCRISSMGGPRTLSDQLINFIL